MAKKEALDESDELNRDKNDFAEAYEFERKISDFKPSSISVNMSLRSMSPTCNLYPLENYTFGTKLVQQEKDRNYNSTRYRKMEESYSKEGMSRMAEGVLLVHDHGHPHVLLLQISSTFFRLPGGKLRVGEAEMDGLQRKLHKRLSPPIKEFQQDWEVGELLSVWWRPNFDNFLYPYIPAHVTRPKEQKKIIHGPLARTMFILDSLQFSIACCSIIRTVRQSWKVWTCNSRVASSAESLQFSLYWKTIGCSHTYKQRRQFNRD